MMGIDVKCPKCGEHIVKPLTALDANAKLACPGCGTVLDFKNIKRGVEEAVKAARFNTTVKARIKL